MRRREFILLTGSAALCSFSAHAQQAVRVRRIGYLGVSSASDRPPLLDAFRKELRKLGWIEGQIDPRCGSFEACFAPEADKRRWKAEVDSWLARTPA